MSCLMSANLFNHRFGYVREPEGTHGGSVVVSSEMLPCAEAAVGMHRGGMRCSEDVPPARIRLQER